MWTRAVGWPISSHYKSITEQLEGPIPAIMNLLQNSCAVKAQVIINQLQNSWMDNALPLEVYLGGAGMVDTQLRSDFFTKAVVYPLVTDSMCWWGI